MGYYLLKLVISATVIVAVSELSKRSTSLGALLASLPLVSVLAMMWLYIDTRDAMKVGALAFDIFWLVLPSLALFLMLPAMLRLGWSFWTSLTMGCVATGLAYLGEIWLLRRLGIRL